MQHDDDTLQSIIHRLRAERPEAAGYELDAIRRRVLARAAVPSRPHQTLASRAAAVVALVLGFTFSAAGAGLAVGGFAGNDQASVAQYPTTTSPGSPVTPESAAPRAGARDMVLPEEARSLGERDVQSAGLQPNRQVGAGLQSGNEPPLLGLAAIPVLLIGLALLGFGVLTRRRLSTE